MRRATQKRSGNTILLLLLLVAIVTAGGYIYTAPEFEREAPTITSEKNIWWNRKEPIAITLLDNEGLKEYQLILSDGKEQVIIAQERFQEPTKSKKVFIAYPRMSKLDPKAKQLTLEVWVRDKSKWHFLEGNKAKAQISIHVDYTKPTINVISHSYSITQGGSALVIFYANDTNLKEVFIEAGGQHYLAQPYYKEGYYASLIAWPFQNDNFHANVVATDIADNIRHADIPFYLKTHRYRTSFIRARDKFINGKITDLVSNDPEYAHIDDKIEKLKAVNETMRLKNEALIHTLSKNLSSELLQEWKINRFYPLRNGKKVASYGDERYYYYGDKSNRVSHSFHLGYDLASTKMATIKTSNAGKVVYTGDNGIYGNMPMIDHGLGLYSLYGHCSKVLVSEGEEVSQAQAIAKTGASGLALGDHLHFGLLVQGVEVRPVEWFDKAWIRKNIDAIFEDAQSVIDTK